MARLEKREAALKNLFFMPAEDPLPEEYPHRLMLPPYIHEMALSALDRTIFDLRERTMHFRYRNERWSGGPCMRGTVIDPVLGTSHSSSLHGLLGLVRVPDIHVRTHQSPDFSKLQKTAGQPIREPYHIAAMPSADEVRDAIISPIASVGHLVAAEDGLFMWIHRNLDYKKPHLQTPRPERELRRISAQHAMHFMEAADAIAREGDVRKHDLYDKLRTSRIWALKKNYVCYSNNNPEKSILLQQSVAAPPLRAVS